MRNYLKYLNYNGLCVALENAVAKSKVKPQLSKYNNHGFPIIGIGASAGGLDALKDFFDNLPENCGIAFVVLMHRAPDKESLLTEILSQHTLHVMEAADGMLIEPNHVYLSPPRSYLSVINGLFKFNPDGDGLSLPINFFFHSLAEYKKQKAVGIVLSGTGSDGTLGSVEINRVGGIVIAQNPDTAEFKSMPESAIASGVVNYVLAPRDIPGQLCVKKVHKVQMPYSIDKELVENMEPIFAIIRQRIGSDFSFYKTSTMCRRIERRMNIHQIKDPKQYVKYLHENAHEVDMLFKELLIGVTSFFRDKEAFDILAEKALPELLESKPEGYMFRAWVPACSTGEEAYSIAIILCEYMKRNNKNFTVQIFATDLDNKAIDTARNGVYSERLMENVSAGYLQKYFIKEAGTYRVGKNIREMVIFAPQNVSQDPPFTKMDLISCRNLLIYLNNKLQKQIMPLFHYALKPGGILFLGSSESIGSFNNLFETIDNRWKLFSRKEITTVSSRGIIGFPIMTKKIDPKFETFEPKISGRDIANLAEDALLQNYVPPSVVVNNKGKIVYIHGKTGTWLEPISGYFQADQSILDMARDGLGSELAIILRKAISSDSEVTRRNIQFKSNGEANVVNITAKKITYPESLLGLFIIAFHAQKKTTDSPDEKKGDIESPAREKTQKLEEELESIKKDLRSSIEDLEISNEELQSTNEELQSTNEELETSKEEMQSLNEELQTVNSELEDKVEELSHANDDMKNLLNNTGIATIFLDNQLNIRRFTVQTQKLIHLIDRDVGRPIGDIVTDLEYDGLVSDAAAVLKTLIFKEIEVRAKDGQWYLARILPYRTDENVIDGLVITFVNISELKKTASKLKKSEEHLLSLIRSAAFCVYEIGKDGHVLSINPAGLNMFGVGNLDELLHKSFTDVGSKDSKKIIDKYLKNALEGNAAEFEFTGGVTGRYYATHFVPIVEKDGRIERVMGISQDITERKAAESEITR
jgi:two-component system CheB/CheR fusion protein